MGTTDVDIVVIDDRYVNQNGTISGPENTKLIWTTFDLLTSATYTPNQQREHLTALRRAGYCFVPLAVQELSALVAQATIVNDELVETAELKAVRENLQLARMSNGLQFPNEHVWLDNVSKAFLEVAKGQWHDGMDE